MISIHALREEGDIWKALCWSRPILISIHALREEGDLPKKCRALPPPYFYPRPPRGGRLCGLRGRAAAGRISIHALREEGDSGYRLALNRLLISIHALREEGDPDALQTVVQRDDFYPRPPRGGRRVTINGCIIRLYFYPRPPRGGRHLRFRHSNRPSRFLSTPSARRATDRRTQGPAGCRKFLSTPSARRATAGVMSLIFKSWKFLSTPSARRATWLSSLSARRWRISIHALREEGDLKDNSKTDIL